MPQELLERVAGERSQCLRVGATQIAVDREVVLEQAPAVLDLRGAGQDLRYDPGHEVVGDQDPVGLERPGVEPIDEGHGGRVADVVSSATSRIRSGSSRSNGAPNSAKRSPGAPPGRS